MSESLPSYLLDTKTTLVNLTNTIFAHFGIPPFHETIPYFEDLLKGKKQVALFLFDGMGKSILDAYPHTSKEMKEHGTIVLHCVNPATTVASTTAVLTGRFPVETNWVGWSQQMDEFGFPIDCFPGRSSLTGNDLPDKDYMEHHNPVKRLDVICKEHGVKGKILYTGTKHAVGPKNLRELFKEGSRFFDEGGQFLYGYWPEPDHSLHGYGTRSWHIRLILWKIKRFLRKFAAKNPDVLILAIADHSLIDVNYVDLKDYPNICSLMEKPLSIEGRTPTFWVKEGKKEEFAKEFASTFPSFTLYESEDLLEQGYFGVGQRSPNLSETFGDFVAVSHGNDLIIDSTRKKNVHIMRGHHGGGTKEEKEILVLAYNAGEGK